MTETVIVIDFETTGLSPSKGARATEVAAIRLVDDEFAGHFHSLMNAGVTIPPQIEKLTGITNAMLGSAPPAASVLLELSAFINDAPLVAHNARFDQSFLEAEYGHLQRAVQSPFACTMKLAQRIYPRAPNFKLRTLMAYADIPQEGNFHRALSDATATASLWLQIKRDLVAQTRIEVLNHAVMCRIANRSDYWLKLIAENPQEAHRDGT